MSRKRENAGGETGKSEGVPSAISGKSPKRFEIEWFEEEGHAEKHKGLFASPSPEPAKQPFEIIREPRPHREKHAPADQPSSSDAAQTGRPPTAPEAPLHRKAPARPAVKPDLHVRLFWGFLPILLFIAGYSSVVYTQHKVGMSWDEAYYYEPSMHAADWLIDVLRGSKPYSAQAIDEAWGGEANHPEHPSLVKLATGLAIRLFPDPKNHLFAMRLPSAIFFGLSLSLIYLLGRRAWGTQPGLAAALIFAMMPRIFGHAHFASYETPLVAISLLCIFCYLRGLDAPLWSFFTGIVFGLALATKINAFFLPIPLILWSHLYARDRYINNIFCLLTVSPLVMVAVWPWLWPNPPLRLASYLSFHAEHQQTALYFLGQTWGYGGPNAPWYYPLVMIGVTIPMLSLTLIFGGVLKSVVKMPRRPYGALYLMLVVILLAVASAPSTPRYDGERLFLQVFPFLALLGGSAFTTIMSILEDWDLERIRRGERGTFRTSRLVCNALLVLIIVEGIWADTRYYPYLLSYFNHMAGGVKGAEKSGFEVTYWGESVNLDVIDALNKLPDGSKLMPLALHEKCLRLYQDWGYLKPGIQIDGPPPYGYHLIQMRRGFFRTAENQLEQKYQPTDVWTVRDVPILKLYHTPGGL